MAKRSFTVGIVLAACMLCQSSARAVVNNEGGCDALADAIRVMVQHAWQTHMTGAGLRHDALPGAATTMRHCGTTAAVASGAFSSALRHNGLQVRWNNDGLMDPGDYCLSHRIDQCYPSQGGHRFVAPASATQFVLAAWQGVVAAVARQMPFGRGSDISYFDRSELQNALAISLDLVLHGALDDAGWPRIRQQPAVTLPGTGSGP